MERFRLVEPNESHEVESREFIEEFYSHNSTIHGVGGLHRNLDNYRGWLERLEELHNIEPDENYVPEDVYFLIRESDNRIVGMLDLRRCLNERLRNYGGNIGYCIRPTERRQAYSLINLYLGLLRCQKLGIEEVVIDSDDWNAGSYRTIENLGGVYQYSYYDEHDNGMVRRHVNNVNQSILEHQNEYEPRIIR